MTGDGIVEMRFSTMAKRSDLRVEDVQERFRNQGISREGLFHSHRGFSPVLRWASQIGKPFKRFPVRDRRAATR
jgi:hypothetical protein